MRRKNPNKAGKNDVINLLSLAHRDYIAARFLLLNDFYLQGLTLSATAVEKYLKVVLAIREGVFTKDHMDKLGNFKGRISRAGINLFDELDPRFLHLLQDVYKLRYYDQLSCQTQVGFLKWQVLGELDYTIHTIDSKLEEYDAENRRWRTPYRSSVLKKDQHIISENYLLNGQDKSAFMERTGPSCILYIHKGEIEVYMAMDGISATKYDGRIVTVTGINLPQEIIDDIQKNVGDAI
ncbi:hypothetical protein [Marinobacter alexandrii]|uniref:hypothetical protein n=1 Tax=Marinobacter alexandrii TaxID=2570351 RepID=UPI0032646E42